MAKIQIKSEKLTPFGGLFSIMEQFDSTSQSQPASAKLQNVFEEFALWCRKV